MYQGTAMPLDPMETVVVLWQLHQELHQRTLALTHQDIMRKHELDVLWALCHGLMSENQSLRLRVMKLEDEAQNKNNSATGPNQSRNGF